MKKYIESIRGEWRARRDLNPSGVYSSARQFPSTPCAHPPYDSRVALRPGAKSHTRASVKGSTGALPVQGLIINDLAELRAHTLPICSTRVYLKKNSASYYTQYLKP